jgi:hypothetical protein
MGRLVFAVSLKVGRAESLRPAGRPLGSPGPGLAAGDAPTGAEPATFDLGAAPYGWHGTGQITLRSIAERASHPRRVTAGRLDCRPRSLECTHLGQRDLRARPGVNRRLLDRESRGLQKDFFARSTASWLPRRFASAKAFEYTIKLEMRTGG